MPAAYGPGKGRRGFRHAHLRLGERFAPDLLADRDMRIGHRIFGPLTIVTPALPASPAGRGRAP